MIKNQIRKEIKNEITKEIDEDTSEVKSSSVVKWKENLSMGFHSEEKPKTKRLLVPPQLKGANIKTLRY